MKKFFTKKKTAAFVSVLTIVAMLVVGTFAARIVLPEDPSEITGTSYAIEVFNQNVEKAGDLYTATGYEVHEGWDVGETVYKDIGVKNLKASVFVRVKLTEWVDGVLKTNPYIGTTVSNFAWATSNIIKIADWTTQENVWVLDTDGYIYWIGVLDKGARTKTLVDSVKLLTALANDEFSHIIKVLPDAVSSDLKTSDAGATNPGGYIDWGLTTGGKLDTYYQANKTSGSTVTDPVDGVALTAANFPDATFLAYLKDEFDDNNDGELSSAEVAAVTTIEVPSQGIISLAGIEYLPALTVLVANDNQLTSIDVSKNTALTYLAVDQNQLIEIDVSNNTALRNLYLGENNLTTIDLSKNTVLRAFSCSGKQDTNCRRSRCECPLEWHDLFDPRQPPKHP